MCCGGMSTGQKCVMRPGQLDHKCVVGACQLDRSVLWGHFSCTEVCYEGRSTGHM